MTIPLQRYFEVAVYALLNFIPSMFLALYPFRKQMRFSLSVNILLIFLLGMFQIMTGFCSAFKLTDYRYIISVLSTLLYMLFYFLAVKAHFGKILFTLLLLSNMADLIVVSSKCLEGFLFPYQALEPYHWTNSFCMLLMNLCISVPLFFYFRRFYTSSIHQNISQPMWRFLWLVPGTFDLASYWLIYEQYISPNEVALQPGNTVYLFFIDAGALLVYHIILMLINEQAKNQKLEQRHHQLSLQTIQYENLQDKIDEARRAKHDMHHHIILMQEYLHNQRYQELEDYLNQYQSHLPEENTYSFCRNHPINALLSYFYQLAQQKNIEADFRVHLDENVRIPEYDLSVLLGNLLENAIHACSVSKLTEKKILVRIKSEHDALLFAVDNTFDGKVLKSKDGSYLSTKKNGSGLGLSSVRAIVEQHHGILNTEINGNMFCVSVMLNYPA